MMQAFFQWTAWEMEKPQAYSLFHIVGTLVLLATAIWGAWKLRNADQRKNRWVLGIAGGFLLLAEVYKIAFHMTVNPYGYSFWGVFPYQLCSVPMYLSLFCAFCKNEKINSWLYECMFAVNIVGGIMAFAEPSGIHHAYLTLTIHAYIWHMMLVFLGLYLFMSKRACVERGGYKKAVLVYLGSCVIAQACNLIFGDKINCFYISPYRQSPLAIFKDIYASFGWVANMVLLVLAILLAAGIVCFVGFRIRKHSLKKALAKQEI